jgi:hypothetical protein
MGACCFCSDPNTWVMDADLTGWKDAIDRLRFRLIKLKGHGWCARLMQQILGRADLIDYIYGIFRTIHSFQVDL